MVKSKTRRMVSLGHWLGHTESHVTETFGEAGPAYTAEAIFQR
jgi:hypothetical protein